MALHCWEYKALLSLHVLGRNTSHLIQEGDAREFLNREAQVSHLFTRRPRESSSDSPELGSGDLLLCVVAHPVSRLSEAEGMCKPQP